jgi:O-methyltransferase
MKTITTYEELALSLIDSGITMVWKELFDMPLRHFENIDKIEGDIVECGVWRGGYLIFLSHLFSDKKIWACDSYEGFQPLDRVNYKFKGERHTPSFTHGAKGPLAISLEEVKNNFKNYGLDEDRIKYLKGFVNETLPSSGIEKISLLRVDVDAYSATLEVLDNLYSKVQFGGYIIFDDLNLTESYEAVKYFLNRENLPLEVYNPYTDELYSLKIPITNTDSGFHAGSYIIKK